jgi:hypothetical protein
MEHVIWCWLQSIPLFWIHFIASGVMLGIIWFVQVVHYPLYHAIDGVSFRNYHRRHMTRTSFVIAPVMLVELGSGVGLLLALNQFNEPSYFIFSMWLLAGIWTSTFCIQVPFHRKLDLGKNTRAIKWLVITNWIRTILWTVRVVLLVLAENA